MPQAATTPGGGLATWLRMPSHLSKPSEAPAEPSSPSGSDSSDASDGSGGTRSRTVATLDFNEVKPKAAAAQDTAATAAPKPASEPAPAAKGQAAPAPAASQRTSRRPARSAAAARAPSQPSSVLSLPAVQLVLLCLVAGLLLVAPLALRVVPPSLVQRYLPGKQGGARAGIWSVGPSRAP